MKNNIIKTSKTYLEFSNWIDAHEFDEYGRPLTVDGKLFCTTLNGYPAFKIKRNDGKYTHVLLHRFVATLFLDNPTNLRTICHKNGDKMDYRICNLKWSSNAEPQQISVNCGNKTHYKNAVFATNTKTNHVMKFESISLCAKHFMFDWTMVRYYANLNALYKNTWKFEIVSNREFMSEEDFNDGVKNQTIIEHPTYKGYFGSLYDGKIISYNGNNRIILKPMKMNSGYIRYNLSKNRKVFCHRFLYECFCGYELNADTQVDHIDGNKTNNAITNLQLLSAKENTVKSCGKKIKIFHNDGTVILFNSLRECAKHFNVRPSTIRAWTHGGNGFKKHNIMKLTFGGL